MTWLGDALVIYRCYCVWNNNLPLVILPLLLLGGSIAVNIYTLSWFQHPMDFSRKSEIMSLNAIYPISLIQNVITTGLIALKIWNQHRQSSASGVVDRSSRLSLIKIMRIIVESAMVYTVQLFILIILYFRNDTFQYIVQAAIVPDNKMQKLAAALELFPLPGYQITTAQWKPRNRTARQWMVVPFPNRRQKNEDIESQQPRVTFEH